jgi:hypothetical protein
VRRFNEHEEGDVENSSGSTAGYTSSPGTTGNGDTERPLLDQAKEQTQQVIQQTQQKAGEVVDRAREQVRSQLADQKERAAGSLESVADALRQAGQGLRDHDQGALGDYVQSAAEMVERVSDYLSRRDMDQLVREVEDMARRQPGLFVGGAFALGFLAARFLKSSRSNGRSTTARETSFAHYPLTGDAEYDTAMQTAGTGVDAAYGSADTRMV